MPSIGVGVVVLRVIALVAAVLCIEAIGDGRTPAALGFGLVALAFSGFPEVIFKYLRGRRDW